MFTYAEPNCAPLGTLGPSVTETVAAAPSVDMAEEADLTPAPFASITPDELETLRSLLCDKDIARIRANLGRRDVLWNCEDFAEKLGFSKKANAYRFANQRNLIKYSLPYKAVIGVGVIDGMLVINPIPEDAEDKVGAAHRVVKFMETWPLLQWMALAPAELGARVAAVLCRILFARNDRDNMLCMQLDEAKKQLEDAKREVGGEVVYLCKLRTPSANHNVYPVQDKAGDWFMKFLWIPMSGKFSSPR